MAVAISEKRSMKILFSFHSKLFFPLCFEDSSLFNISLSNQALKYSSYIHETRKKIGKEIIIYSGNTIKYEELSHIKNRGELINFLKDTTYSLKKNTTIDI